MTKKGRGRKKTATVAAPEPDDQAAEAAGDQEAETEQQERPPGPSSARHSTENVARKAPQQVQTPNASPIHSDSDDEAEVPAEIATKATQQNKPRPKLALGPASRAQSKPAAKKTTQRQIQLSAIQEADDSAASDEQRPTRQSARIAASNKPSITEGMQKTTRSRSRSVIPKVLQAAAQVQTPAADEQSSSEEEDPPQEQTLVDYQQEEQSSEDEEIVEPEIINLEDDEESGNETDMKEFMAKLPPDSKVKQYKCYAWTHQ